MAQLIEFPVLAGDSPRQSLSALIKLCKDVPEAGESFRDFRARLRAARIWDRDRPLVPLRFLAAGGSKVVPSATMRAIAAAADDEAAHDALAERLWEINPLLFKVIVELLGQRAHGRDEIYKHLGSFAYRGAVPSRPDLEAWLVMALALGIIRPLGIAVALDKRAQAFSDRVTTFDVDEFLAEDRPEPEPVIPVAGDEEPAPAAAPATPATDAAAEVSVPVVAVAAVPAATAAALRWFPAAAGLKTPLGRDRPVPVVRFAGQPVFADDVAAETTRRVASWWADCQATVTTTPIEDFGFDPEGWVEGAEEMVYRIAVAAALVFRLETDRGGVVRAYRALDDAGVLGDLYHGTVPESLPDRVDAKALMLASLAARRCAESPELAVTIEQQKSAADVFAVLDAALGRGLFRIELFWMMDRLGKLGVLRHDDLADFTALPHRLVRDTLFRLGYVTSPYAHDPGALAAAARAARRATGGTGPADEILASFAIAAGCAYDCPHRKVCDFPCRERAE